MYGTIARYRLRPGMEEQVLALSRELAGDPPPGFVTAYVYRLDSGGDEYVTAAVFTDREAYERNSQSERQQRWAARVRELLAADPHWSDGEIVHVAGGSAATGSAPAGHVGRCPCGVEFRVAADDQLDHLVDAIRQHARGSHDRDLSREQILAEVSAA